MSLVDEIESHIEYTQNLCQYCEGYGVNDGLAKLTIEKYSDSQPIIAGRLISEVNDIADRYHSPVLINYDDLQVLHDNEQCLKRTYKSQQYSNKIQMLSEYYKFHNEVPRLFMLYISETLDNYIDERRQLEYVKVTNILKKENNSDNYSQKRQTRHQPMNKLLDSIDLSYEDFEKRDKRKEHKNKKGIKGKKDRFQIQSIDQRIVPLSCQANKSSKQSSKKKLHTLSLAGPNNENSSNGRSYNALSRHKSRSNLQNISKQVAGNNRNALKQPFVRKEVPIIVRKLSKEQIKPSYSKTELVTINHQIKSKDQQCTDLARMRCNSRPFLKTFTVPLKTIDMNKLGSINKLQPQHSKTNIHNLGKIDKKPNPSRQKSQRNNSINCRQQSKNSSKNILISVSSTAQLHIQHSQHSSVNNQNHPPIQYLSKSSKPKSIDGMFNGILSMKKYRTNQP